MLKHAALLILCGLMPGCTIVQLQGATPSTSVHFGVLKIVPEAGARSVSYRMRGIGIVPSINGITFGYAREDTVLAYHPEDCRIVLFGGHDQDQSVASHTASQLGNADICEEGQP